MQNLWRKMPWRKPLSQPVPAPTVRTFEKLVRDKVIDAIQTDGEEAESLTLDDRTFLLALADKLVEEANEARNVIHAHDVPAAHSEMADVAAVMIELMKQLVLTAEKLREIEQEKRKRKGGFDKRIYLIRTIKRAA